MNLFFLFSSVSELYVDVPDSGVAERVPVSIDVSVLEIGCQCKQHNMKVSICF